MDEKLWAENDYKNLNQQEIFEHYGYEYNNLLHGVGFWKNDGTVLKKLEELPAILEQFADKKQKVKIIFDYDPDFLYALVQVWGLP